MIMHNTSENTLYLNLSQPCELYIWGASQPQHWLPSIQYSPGAQSIPCIYMLVSGCNLMELESAITLPPPPVRTWGYR